MKKKYLVYILIFVVAIVVIGVVLYRNSQSTNGLTKVESYRHYDVGVTVCDAYSPGCGLCIGKVVDKECYIDKAKLTKEELKYMGFD